MSAEEVPARSLVCVECGRVQATDERGWRAYLTTDEEEPAEALLYCPECSMDEFGPDDPNSHDDA
jgi:hypothetical protein